MSVARLKPWLVLFLVASTVAFILLAVQADEGGGPWLFGIAAFQGFLAVLVVWRERETPSSAWRRLKQPPREGL